MKLKHWLANHPKTSVSILLTSTVLVTLAVSSSQVSSADPPSRTVAVPMTGKTPDSPLIGQSMYVFIGLGQERYHFTVLNVDPSSGMICLQELSSEKIAEPPVPFWVPLSLIKVMFGGKGLTGAELQVLTKKLNASNPLSSTSFPE